MCYCPNKISFSAFINLLLTSPLRCFNSWTHVMTTACWWVTGVAITHTVSRRRPGPAAWRSSWTTPAAGEHRSVTPSAGSSLLSSTPVRTRTRHSYSLISHMIGIFMILLLLLHSLALPRNPWQGRDELLLCPRQWWQPEDGHHPGWKRKTGPEPHQRLHLVSDLLWK